MYTSICTIALACALLAQPARADERTGELSDRSPTWDRISDGGISIDGTCGGAIATDPVSQAVPFARYYIQTDRPGTPLDIRVNSLEPTPLDLDPFIAVYCGSFEPDQPLMNLLAADDDTLGHPNPGILLPPELYTLQPGETLVAIVTAYSSWEQSRYGAFEIALGEDLFFAMPCPADLNGDGVLNFFDAAGFIELYSNADPGADLNGDGVLNFFDVSTFVSDYSAGCP